MRNIDIIAGIILLALSIVTLFETRQLPIGGLTSPQPGFFPLILAVILGILALVLLGQAFRAKEKDEGKNDFWGSSGGRKRISFTLGVLFIVAIFFETVGYLISAFFLIAFLLIVIGNQKWWVAITAGVLSAIFSYLLFGLLLKGSLPAGILV
jgi:putative tricarboxylic transport membrane protein